MKSLIGIAAMAVLLFGMAEANAFAGKSHEIHRARIEGYGIGKWTVSGTVEEQFVQNVVNPLSRDLSKASPGTTVEIDIYGFADPTGSGGQNDNLTEKRVNAVVDELKEVFSGVKIHPHPKGNSYTKDSSLNKRMVIVEWKIIPATPISKDSQSSFATVVIGGGGAMLSLVVFLFMLRRGGNEKKTKMAPAVTANNNVVAISPKTGDTMMLSGNRGGLIYFMETYFENGFWITPIPTDNGESFNFRRTKRGVQDYFRAALKSEKMWPRIARLIAEGKITVQREGEVCRVKTS